MGTANIEMHVPLALAFAPEGGQLAHLIQSFEEPNFQIQTVEKVIELADYSLQSIQNLCLCMIDVTSKSDDFKKCYEALDMGFRNAGGPVFALTDGLEEEEEKKLLSLGATKVVDVSLGLKAVQLIVSLEIQEFSRVNELKKELMRRSSAIGQIVSGVFRFKTRREAQNLATMLSMTCPNPMPIVVGLTELLINGVEHGCLGIGHDEKGKLIEAGLLTDEVSKRRGMSKYQNRFVTVEFSREPNKLCFLIRDGGEGFDYQLYVAEKDGHSKKHGRGIMMAKGCFEILEYRGCGNEVYAVHVFGEASEE